MKNIKLKRKAKVPMIMQLETLECGAACLAMILAYYDKWVPLEQLRIDCDVSRDGSKASNIMAAARIYGMNVAAYKAKAHELLDQDFFPCIAFWDNNHFIVLEGFKDKKAVINDPARGRMTVPWEYFEQGFSGVIISCKPNKEFVKSGKKKSTLSFIKKSLKGYRPAVVFVIVTTLLTSLLSIINPVFSRIFFDRILSKNNPDWLPSFLFISGCFSFVTIFINCFTVGQNLKIQGKMDSVGNTTFLWHALRLPVQYFEQRLSGDLVTRQASNGQISYTAVNTIAPIAINFVMTVFYFVIMLRYSVVLTAIGLGTSFINYIISIFVSKKRINITRVKLREETNLYGFTVSGINLIESIKAGGSEKGFFKKWGGFQAAVNAQNVKFNTINQFFVAIPSVLSALLNAIVLGVGVFLVLQGEFTVGMIIAFQGFLSSFLGPVSQMISAGQSLQEMVTQIERIEDVMEYPVDMHFKDEIDSQTDNLSDDNIVCKHQKLNGYVEVKNLTFGYTRIGKPVIQNFSMSAKPGQKIAIVGHSGCGKSTVSKLLLRLYHPWSGEILFDGTPIEDIDRDVFVNAVSVVDQDIILFNDTIANNITLWDDSISDKEIIQAAKDARIHDDIVNMEGEYRHRIHEDGTDLSGGQRQRIEIARALVKNPVICILDEATSALDAKTESEVIHSITNRGTTCIIIAHRLSTIRNCDEIIVLDKGKIVERGTHDELYQAGGYYTKLVSNT